MLFNSWQYAVFLPIVFAVYWLLPHRFRWVLLLAASYYFYMSWNAKYVVLILFTTVISWGAALLLERSDDQRAKKGILAGTLVACLGVLAVFKYFNFFFQTLSDFLALFTIRMHPVTLRLLLPVGISFYTFQTLSYVIDVYRGRIAAERHFGIYATFVSFFPQLVAGPIERTENLLPQLRAEHRFDYDKAAAGMRLMAWGFFKKMVVADNLAVFVDRVYDNVTAVSGFGLIMATVLFAVQIYCDFSGYSDIARGSARLMGIELMENFRSPYFSTDIREFWSRWHISLSTWLRDYIYIPLGGSRCGKLKNYRNLLVTFLVSGLWHGANGTFVVWGGIHGLAQIGEKALGIRPVSKRGSLRWWVRAGLVFLFSCAAWVFFRAQTLSEAFYVFTHLFSGIGDPARYLYRGFSALGMGKYQSVVCLLVYLLPLAVYDYASLKTDVIAWVGKQKAWLRWLLYFVLTELILLFHAFGEVSFVYFQF